MTPHRAGSRTVIPPETTATVASTSTAGPAASHGTSRGAGPRLPDRARRQLRDRLRDRVRELPGGERGSYAPLELALTTVLILFPTAILVVSLPTWVERQSLARLAAQEAARAVVLADTASAGTTAGQAIVAQMAVNHDVDPDDLAVTFTGALERGGSVTATVTIRVPALAVPLLTDGPGPGFTLTSDHTEAVDTYRAFSGAAP